MVDVPGAVQRQARLPYLSEWRGEGQKRWHFTHTNYSPNKKGNYDEENNIRAYFRNVTNNDGAICPGANDLSAGMRRRPRRQHARDAASN